MLENPEWSQNRRLLEVMKSTDVLNPRCYQINVITVDEATA